MTLAIRFGALHHNTGGEPRYNGVLVIEGERIAAIGTDVPAGARVLEAACVVPGLINAHAHLESSGESNAMTLTILTTPTQRAYVAAGNARKTLEAGVTTIREIGATGTMSIDLRDAIASGVALGPAILAAGRLICMTGGHGWFFDGREANGPWDVRTAVREQRKAGADCIKFIATGGVLTKGAVPGIDQLSEEELRAGVDEAHRHGMRCAAHAIGTNGIKNALRAGVDSIEHGHLIDDEGIALMVDRGTYLVPTLAAIRCIVEAPAEAGMPDYVTRKAREIAEHAEGNLRRARAAGVRFAGGSDAGTPFNLHENYAYEFELLQSMLGMDPREALHTVTAAAADLLGVARGRLAPGEVADLVLLERDPDHELAALRAPRAVVKGGQAVFERRS
ncbi:MAG TPA: amidohydrolase family protein [Candidatus Baltobacteraceae bacterium]|nr:amidohydrolase family protein [Candidatus Baltobacteraceae bacterium]